LRNAFLDQLPEFQSEAVRSILVIIAKQMAGGEERKNVIDLKKLIARIDPELSGAEPATCCLSIILAIRALVRWPHQMAVNESYVKIGKIKCDEPQMWLNDIINLVVADAYGA
jgi:hypothetical protein